MVHLSLTPINVVRRNHLIEDRTAKKKVTDYQGKEFLVKVTAGDDGFGLDRSAEKKLGVIPAQNQDLQGLTIYDEFRFISGVTKCQKIWDIVRQFGKLSGDKIYNKRIFLYAQLHRGNKEN